MNSEIIFFIMAGIALGGIIIWIIYTEQRLKKFFTGKNAKDLEDTITNMGNSILNLKLTQENTAKEIVIINKKLKKSIQGLEVIRFNPFPDQGSNQSFTIGMLNENGDGLVLSSLYSRERMSVFAKPIKMGKSEYELTGEEKEVLEKVRI